RTCALHPYDLSMPILEGADVRLNYFVAGEGAPVTLLHGFTQSGRSWQELINAMPGGWRWVVPDLRGHGETRLQPGAMCTMDTCLADLEILWDHLGIERTHLVGYSMGGRLALHVAARKPERLLSLVTIGAHAGLEEGPREGRRLGDEALAQRIESDGLEAFVKYWSGLPMFARGASRSCCARATRCIKSDPRRSRMPWPLTWRPRERLTRARLLIERRRRSELRRAVLGRAVGRASRRGRPGAG